MDKVFQKGYSDTKKKLNRDIGNRLNVIYYRIFYF